ncbi:phage minor capsid protein [Metabacillus bambusae]|uniref:phage minor capsid protein n=1 Tax=Metabacillus bambusae TaxID=2795218 RepID=UPI001FB0F3D4|nr:phage minor capsid protein [Metabacillus bambusae]
MDPLKQQQLAMPTVEVFLAIEEQMLINIAKQLRKHRSLMTEDDIVSWQTEQLAMMGQLTQQNIIAIAKHSGMAVNEVAKALEQAGYSAVEEDEEDLQAAFAMGLLFAPPSIEASQALQDVLAIYREQALEKFNLINTTMLQQSQQVYLDIVNQTVGKVLAGTQTPQEALRETSMKWANKGIPALIKSNGDRMSTEAYLNTVMRSTVNNVANEMQEARMDDFGVDLVEVSSHLGARPRCALFQGRIFSRSGKHPKYPALSTTSYGEAAGLKGVNCRHIFYPFIEGVSRKTYKPYDEEKNRKEYEESQQQRLFERRIREAKRELHMMQAMGDDLGLKMAKQKVRDRQAEMREFIEATGRTRNRPREQVY